MSDLPTVNSLEKPSDLGKKPEAIARRWKLELKLAAKRESPWQKKSKDIYKLYTPETPATNSFGILWTNTETLRQAVYNSLPEPDCRRRYQDEDPLGKAVAEVMTRALEFCQDVYDFDSVLKGDVLSMLLAGRAVSRVRYIPDIRKVEGEATQAKEGDELQTPDAYEEIEWEQTICERVQYEDFRILCAAKVWEQVTAIAFRHRFTRDDCIEKFGKEIGGAITLDSADDEDVKSSKDCEDLFKTAEIWEIWDKDEKEVIWICQSYANPCKIQDDPLRLSGFFPIPRPLYAIENDQTLIPAPLYTQYEQQAKELNKISGRINKLIDALKVRGIYDATMGELSQLMKAGDNDLVPAQDTARWAEAGGIEKAIFFMPIEQAAKVIGELYIQRDQCKQIIYEITGIADIMRSASDPAETFGAQKIKTQWGTQRLQRMQREVQRYIRDLIRLKAEIIAEKFQPETLEQMTLVQLPHQAELDAEKQRLEQMAQQYQMQAQQAQMSGQQPPPPPPELEKLKQPMPISWEKVVEAMRSDATRTYRIDIETDSTLSATQDDDAQGLALVLKGLSDIMVAFGPAVEKGVMDIAMLKELMLVVCRRAKMGTAIEDVINKLKQPPPPKDPEAGKVEAMKAIEQMKGELTLKIKEAEMAGKERSEQHSAQLKAQVETQKQESQAQQNQHQQMLESQRANEQANIDAALEQQRMAFDERLAERDAALKVELEHIKNAGKMDVALVDQETTLASAQISAEAKPEATNAGV
jgi:hypothetical protein